MPLQEQRWPTELGDALGKAVVARQNASAVWREINAGTFEGFEAQPVPMTTVRYFAEKERKRLAREERLARGKVKRKRHRGTIAQKVDAVAHRMVDMAADRVEWMQNAPEEFDASELKDIAEILSKLRRSAPDRPSEQASARAAPSEPEDELSRALRRAG